ncbi:hypothetical protein ACSBR2_021099 [Camellia fascicularis]
MFVAVTSKSNSTSLSEEANNSVSSSSGTRVHQDLSCLNPMVSTIPPPQQPQKIKKKRNLPGNPDPDAEVISLSPKTLMATNRFVCEICKKGFQRDQNLQLHRRGHNLPWKLKQRNNKEIRKRVYVCPEPSCVHHHPSRALGDLTGIKKHFCRKHGEKKWKCEKCSKIYAVQSDWKAHSKTCGTREYRCDCGTLFSRKDSFITHRAFCDALAEESARLSVAANQLGNLTPHPFHLLHHPPHSPPNLLTFSSPHHHHQPPPPPQQQHQHHFPNPQQQIHIFLNPWDPPQNPNPNPNPNPSPLNQNPLHIKHEPVHLPIPQPPQQQQPISSSPFFQPPPTHKNMATSPFQNLHVSTQATSNIATSAHLSATALLQKAATVGSQTVGHVASTMSPEYHLGFTSGNIATWQKSDSLTRDFLGLTGDCDDGGVDVNVNVNVRNLLSFTGGVEFPAAATYNERDHTLLKAQAQGFGFGFAEPPPPPPASETWGNC